VNFGQASGDSYTTKTFETERGDTSGDETSIETIHRINNTKRKSKVRSSV